MISKKNLIAAPARLQRMLLPLQQYNMTIMYRPDKEMLLADTLTCLPSRTDTQIQLNLSLCHIHFSFHKEPPDQDCSRNTTQWRWIQKVYLRIWLHTHHITSFPPVKWFHQGHGEESQETPTRKHGSLNAQARTLPQLWDTPILTDLPSSAEILHGWPAQEAVISRPSKPINICQIQQRLTEIQNTQKEQFDRGHVAKDLTVLKVNEQVVLSQQTRDRSPNMVDRNRNWNPGLWLLIHDTRPQQQSLLEKQSSLEAHLLWWYVISRPSSEKSGKPAWNQLLSRPQAHKGENHVLPDMSYMDTRSVI